MKLRKISNNFHVLETNSYTIWFSYETPIAYKTNLGTTTIRKNDWGSTTGKHINYVKNSCENFIQLDGEGFESTLRYLI